MRGTSALPAVAVLAGACLLAWVETGSIDAGDWLIYAVFAALLLAVVAATSPLPLPPWPALVGLGCLVAYAGWQAVSIAWAALPSLARVQIPGERLCGLQRREFDRDLGLRRSAAGLFQG